MRVFGEDITVAGRQARAAAAVKQAKKATEDDVAPDLENNSFLRQIDSTTEDPPELKSKGGDKITDGGVITTSS